MANPSTRKRILVIGDSMSLAHVTRALVVARRLKAEGHEVTFATGAPHLHLAQAEGWDARTVHCVPPDYALKQIRRGSHIFSLATLKRYVASDLELLRELRPDLIVHDMRMSLNISAQMLGIPYWSIVSGYYTRYYTAPEDPPQTFPLFRFMPMGLARRIFPAAKALTLRHFARNFNRLRLEHGLPPIQDVRDAIVSPHRTLIADLPDYTPCSGLPEHYAFIGPQLWEPDAPAPDWLPALPDDKPVAYVSMGSTGDDGTTDRILQTLKSAGWRALVTGGRERPDDDFLRWAAMAPGSKLLERCQVAICHGGSGTVYQAVSMGVPVVCIPTFHDQEVNVQRVEALGWGRGLHPSRWTGEDLSTAIQALHQADRLQHLRTEGLRLVAFTQTSRAQPLSFNVCRRPS